MVTYGSPSPPAIAMASYFHAGTKALTALRRIAEKSAATAEKRPR